MEEWISYHLLVFFSKLAYLSCVFLQHVFWVKFMDKYGDMVGFSAISACCLLILSHL